MTSSNTPGAPTNNLDSSKVTSLDYPASTADIAGISEASKYLPKNYRQTLEAIVAVEEPLAAERDAQAYAKKLAGMDSGLVINGIIPKILSGNDAVKTKAACLYLHRRSQSHAE